MADGFEFDFDGLDKLERDLETVIKKCPVYATDTLVSIAKEFKNTAKKRANTELKSHERTGAQKKKAIKRKWGHKLLDNNVGAEALVWNSARHFHLIENGHNLVRGGKIVGFVAGKHIMEKTRNEYRDVLPEKFQKMIDDILKGSDF